MQQCLSMVGVCFQSRWSQVEERNIKVIFVTIRKAVFGLKLFLELLQTTLYSSAL